MHARLGALALAAACVLGLADAAVRASSAQAVDGAVRRAALSQVAPAPPAAPAKIWVGRYAEFAQCLRTAEVVRSEEVGTGVTRPRHLFFAPGSVCEGALFSSQFPSRDSGFLESHQSRIAAYELDKLLQLDLVPPAVERQAEGKIGAAQLWVNGAVYLRDLDGQRSPDVQGWLRQVRRWRVFDNLIADVDRNAGNILVLRDPAWQLVLIDHSRAFTNTSRLIRSMDYIDRPFFERLKALDETQLADTVARPRRIAVAPAPPRRDRRALRAARGRAGRSRRVHPVTGIPPPRAVPLSPILAVVFISTLGFSIVLPFLVFLVLRLGGNAFVYGLVGATYSAFQLIGAPLLGRWSDRYGRRRILMLSQGGTALSWGLFLVAILLPVVPLAGVDAAGVGMFTLTVPLVLLFGARALDGLTGGNVSVANAYVADITPEKDRSASFGRMAVAQNLGFVAGPALAGVLGASGRGELLPVLAALVVSLAALVLIVVRLPESTPCAWVGGPQIRSVRAVLGQEMRECFEVSGAARGGLGVVFGRPAVALLLAIHFLVYLAFNFFYVAFPVHAATQLEWTLRGVGFFFAYVSLLMVVAQGPVLAVAARRLADRTLVLAGGIVLAWSFVLFTVEASGAVLVGGALLALGNGLMWPSLLALLSKVAGPAVQGTVQGIAGSSSAVASILGLIVGGVFYGTLGAMVFAAAAAILGGAWLAAWLIPAVQPARP